MLKEFKQFLLRGNVVDLAVGIVIGASFGAVVTSFVKDMITPLIAAVGGKTDFSSLSFTIHNSRFLYGDFLNSIISFVILAAIIFFFIIKPVNVLIEKSRSKKPLDPTTKKCPECFSEIPKEAKRCAYCTSELRK